MSAVHPDVDASGAGGSRQLAERIRAGDRTAEAEFVEHYRRGVRALVCRHTRPGEPLVEDFVQDVFAAALEKLRAGELRDANALPAYLRTMIVHITTAEYRRRKARGETSGIDALEQTSGDADPAETLRAQQLASHIRSVLAELPVERDRAVLVRFYLDEHDKDAICADLGIDPDHFRRVVFRARERLRALLHGAGIEAS